MEFVNTDTKTVSFAHLPQFQVTKKSSEEYGEWVKKTADLVKRPYMQMHRIFTNEDWSLEEIKRYYLNATKHNGKMPSSVNWWWQRKERLARNVQRQG